MTPVEQQRTIKSSNPVLRLPQFTPRGGQKTAARDPRAGRAVTRDRIRAGKDVEQAPTDEHDGHDAPPLLVGDLMTMRDVLPRAAAALATTVLTAVLAWTLLPRVTLPIGVLYAIAAVAALPAAVLVVIQCRGNPSSASLTLTFAACQGGFLGVLSWTVSSHLSPGILVQLVLGTMATSAGALLARALGWIRVNRRFYGFLGAALLGLALLALADWLLLPLAGADGLGLRPFGLGLFTGLLGVALAASFLSLHFRQVEDGVTFGASRDRAWSAAFGLTLTLTWLYVETTRLFTLYPHDDLH
ncbi:Bax inhibitor-1/YccA family protein [Streptomyces sp. NPDC057694]|uniref:Bax inhibitor-1/YccA family membrane protein n=1 Tax=Streptomyces sp. NPDC057694 TaxID=3346216 RepID=UPI003696D34A